MVRASNKVRPSRTARAVRAPETEKPARAATRKEPPKKEAPERRVLPAPKAARVKIVWEVCTGAGKTVQTFPYPEKAAAEARMRALARSSGRSHMLRATKVPME